MPSFKPKKREKQVKEDVKSSLARLYREDDDKTRKGSEQNFSNNKEEKKEEEKRRKDDRTAGKGEKEKQGVDTLNEAEGSPSLLSDDLKRELREKARRISAKFAKNSSKPATPVATRSDDSQPANPGTLSSCSAQADSLPVTPLRSDGSLVASPTVLEEGEIFEPKSDNSPSSAAKSPSKTNLEDSPVASTSKERKREKHRKVCIRKI